MKKINLLNLKYSLVALAFLILFYENSNANDLICQNLFLHSTKSTYLAQIESSKITEHPFTKFIGILEKQELIFTPQTLGLEIEAGLPYHFSKEDMAQNIYNFLFQNKYKSNLTDLKIEENYEPALGDSTYEIKYKKNNLLYTFVVDTDFTVQTEDGYQAIELKSPILREPVDVKLFLQIVKSLKDELGLKEMPHSGGIHIHVGARDYNSVELGFLIKVFSSLESQIIKYFNQKESRRVFSQKTSTIILDYLDRTPPQDLNYKFFKDFYTINNRYFNLNLNSLETHGTIEFRLFNSSVNTNEIFKMVDFVQKFTLAMKSKDNQLMSYLKSIRNETTYFNEQLTEPKSDLNIDLFEVSKIIGANLN